MLGAGTGGKGSGGRRGGTGRGARRSAAGGGGGGSRPGPAAGAGGSRLPVWATVLLALLAALVILYPEPIFQGRVFGSPDAGNAAAFRQVGDEALAAGHYPLWNPYLFAGMPTFGSLAYTPYLYPPSVVFNFLQERLRFPPLTYLFVHLLFGGLGMAYLLSRWRLPPPALVLGAVAWVMLPKVTAWAVHGHHSKLVAAMYLPWILAMAWRVLAGGGGRAVGLLGLLLGLQLLRGHVQITYYTLLAVGWLALLHGIWGLTAAPGERPAPAGRRWRRVGLVAGGLVLGFLIGGALLLPVREYAALSVRGAAEGGGASYEFATGWSLPPAEIVTFVLPSAFGFGKGTYVGQMPFTDYPNYLGFLLLGLAAAAWAGGRRRLPAALAALGGLALLVSFGNYASVLYDLLYRFLPYFNKFRVPSMILVLVGLAAAALGALGAGALARPEGAPPRWLRAGVWTLGLGGAVLFLLGATGAAEGPYLGALRAAAAGHGRFLPPAGQAAAWDLERADLVRLGLLLLTAAAALHLARRRPDFRRRGLVWTLAVLVAVDLAAVDWRIARPEGALLDLAVDAQGQPRLVPAARLLQPYRPPRAGGVGLDRLAAEVGHDRVWPLGSLARTNELMTAHIRSLGGYHPAKLAAYEPIRARLEQPTRPAQRLAGWLAGRIAAAGAPPDLQLYDNPEAVPRARLVSRWAAADTTAGADDLPAFLDRLGAGEVPYRDRVLLAVPPDPAPVPPPAGEALPAPEWVRDGMDEVVLRTAAPVPALLVLADMLTPGWRAEVDGRPVRLLRADLVLRAVAVPAGEHEVRFHFVDPAVRRGLTLTLVGLAGALALIVAAGRLRRRGGEARGEES